jgi:hypothetical protein
MNFTGKRRSEADGAYTSLCCLNLGFKAGRGGTRYRYRCRCTGVGVGILDLELRRRRVRVCHWVHWLSSSSGSGVLLLLLFDRMVAPVRERGLSIAWVATVERSVRDPI